MTTKCTLPRCGHETEGQCFARTKEGRCICLSDTRFNKRKCPFRKSPEQVENERGGFYL